MNKMTAISIKNRLLSRIFTAFPALAAAWGRSLPADRGEVPWTEPRQPLAESCLAIVTTGGVHRTDQPAFDMLDRAGDPSFREVPVTTPREMLTITHDYYDHRDADQDLNLVLPVDRLREIVQAGGIGSLHEMAYCLMGHIDGPHLATLVGVTAPEIARRLAAAKVDYALLVPA